MPRPRRIPLRTCVACGRVRPKRELLRVVRTPHGEVRIDPTGKVSGRGAYVCRDNMSCADAGLREARLAHALDVVIPADVADDLRRAAAEPVEGARR